MRRRVPAAPLPGTPITVVAGSEDRNFTLAMMLRLARDLDAELVTVAGSGHDIQLDTQWNRAGLMVLDRLASTCLDRQP
jgi:pimeloyl-ACP methyl ester carboxylesterase